MTAKELIQEYKKGKRNFRKIILSGANLSGVDFYRVNLSKANFSKANLSKANLSGADLSGVDLSGANLSHITLHKACIDGAILNPQDIGGPGHILCALTDDEWSFIQAQRKSI